MNFLRQQDIKIKVLIILGAFMMTFTQSFSFEVTSTAFVHEGHIPPLYTCEGEDLSPSLHWDNAPANTQSFVIICYDPDAPDPKAPKMTYYHWLLFNIPANTTALPEGVDNVLPIGTKIGKNSNNQQAYKGPCPPIGRHRYFFEVYALDIKKLKDEDGLDLKDGADKNALIKAMGGKEAGQGHILAKAVLMGTYQKQKISF